MRYAVFFFAIFLAVACATMEETPENPLAREAPVPSEDTLITEGPIAVEKGARAVQAGRYEKAIGHMGPLVQEGTIPRHPFYGSAATWLGRAFHYRGDTTQARNIWMLSLRQDRQTEDLPPPADAADAFLNSLSPSALRSSPALVTEVFFRLLQAMGESTTTAADTTLRRHAAQLALIAPDSIAAPLSAYATSDSSAGNAEALDAPTDSLSAVAADLRRWFLAGDPLLATPVNERIVEHIARVREAQRTYSWKGRASGLDDRGEMFVRYGSPSETVSVTNELTQRVVIGTGITPVTLPRVQTALQMLYLGAGAFPAAENEVWVYRNLEPQVHFIFVESEEPGSPYLTGTAQDLLPRELRGSPQSNSQRRSLWNPVYNASTSQGFLFEDEEWKAFFSIYLELYRQLMSVDEEYANRYSSLRSFDPSTDVQGPSSFMNTQVANAKADSFWMQQAEVPKQQTQADLPHPSMPVDVRTVRFLEEDGSTRTEIYWGIRTDSLAPSRAWMDNTMRLGFQPSGSYLVQATGVLRTSALRTEGRASRIDTITVEEIAGREPLVSRPLVFRGAADPQRLSLEWIQQSVGMNGERGPFVHKTERQLPPQPALSTDPGQLEMSDLRLLSVPEETVRPPEGEEARQRVIPFEQIEADRPIALNFEIYHLTFGSDDRTEYTVEYAAEYETEAGGLAGLFGGTETKQTSMSSSFRGTERRTSEYILLELDEVTGLTEPTPVSITAEVTDELTGQTVDRSVSFTLVPDDDL